MTASLRHPCSQHLSHQAPVPGVLKRLTADVSILHIVHIAVTELPAAWAHLESWKVKGPTWNMKMGPTWKLSQLYLSRCELHGQVNPWTTVCHLKKKISVRLIFCQHLLENDKAIIFIHLKIYIMWLALIPSHPQFPPGYRARANGLAPVPCTQTWHRSTHCE